MLLSCQSLSISLEMPTNLIRRDYCISLYRTMTVTSWWCNCDVIMIRLTVTHKQIWREKNSFYTAYNNTALGKYWPNILIHFCWIHLKHCHQILLLTIEKNSLTWNSCYIQFGYYAKKKNWKKCSFYLCVCVIWNVNQKQ